VPRGRRDVEHDQRGTRRLASWNAPCRPSGRRPARAGGPHVGRSGAGAQDAFWTSGRRSWDARAAGGITRINVVGNTAGVIGPPLIGRTLRDTGSFTAPIYDLAAALAVGALLVLLLSLGARRPAVAAVQHAG
jgi:hypothetical protein